MQDFSEHDYSDSYFKNVSPKQTDSPLGTKSVKDIGGDKIANAIESDFSVSTQSSTPNIEQIEFLEENASLRLQKSFVPSRDAQPQELDIDEDGKLKLKTLFICREAFTASPEQAIRQGGNYLQGGTIRRIQSHSPREILEEAAAIHRTHDRVEIVKPGLDRYLDYLVKYLDGTMSIDMMGKVVSRGELAPKNIPESIKGQLERTEGGRLIMDLAEIIPGAAAWISYVPPNEIDPEGDYIFHPAFPEDMAELGENDNVCFVSAKHGAFMLKPQENMNIGDLQNPKIAQMIIKDYMSVMGDENTDLSQTYDWNVKNTRFGSVATVLNESIENDQYGYVSRNLRDHVFKLFVAKFLGVRNWELGMKRYEEVEDEFIDIGQPD